jgi:hypothetical protein
MIYYRISRALGAVRLPSPYPARRSIGAAGKGHMTIIAALLIFGHACFHAVICLDTVSSGRNNRVSGLLIALQIRNNYPHVDGQFK